MTWREDAACTQSPNPDLWFAKDDRLATVAKEICLGCPVRSDCLTDALAEDDPHGGIRAGFTYAQRKRMTEPKARVPRKRNEEYRALRVEALALASQGASCAQIATRLNVTERSVERWLAA